MNVTETAEALKGTFDVDPDVKHHFLDGVYAKQMSLPKGFTAYSHKHTYEHMSILRKGVAVVTTDTDETTYHAPAYITIRANLNHAIHALEDVSWYCVHVTDETDEAKVDQVLIGE